MKKCLFILALIFMCAFLFVSCDDFLDMLGDIPDIVSDGGENTPYDYSNGGGGSLSSLSGVWTTNTTEIAGSFLDMEMVNCVLTVTIDGSNISITEVDEDDNVVKSVVGTLELDGHLIKITKQDPPIVAAENLTDPWISIKPLDENIGLFENDEKEDYYSHEYDDWGYYEYTADGNKLIYDYILEAAGDISEQYIKFDFSPTNYSSVALSSTFTRQYVRSELAKVGDDLIVIEQKDRSVTATVVEKEADPSAEGIDVIFKYEETNCDWDKLLMWYKYDPENPGTLKMYWRGEVEKLSKEE